MKASHYIAIALLVIATCTSGIYAQQANAPKATKGSETGKGFRAGIGNLTEEQQTKIKDLRLAFTKESLTLKNQLGELKAKQRTLTTADKADMKAIEANIDEISKVQAQLMKKQAAMHQQIRSLLTDEQRVMFDSRRQGDGQRMGGMKKMDGMQRFGGKQQMGMQGPGMQGMRDGGRGMGMKRPMAPSQTNEVPQQQ